MTTEVTPDVTAPQAKGPLRYLLILLACLCLGIAALGVVLPGLPTTEFLLIAAWAAARSSPRFHNWLHQHRVFGPILQQWQQGYLPRKVKWGITTTMSMAALILTLTVSHRLSVVFTLVCMAAVLIWLWRWPEAAPPASTHSRE